MIFNVMKHVMINQYNAEELVGSGEIYFHEGLDIRRYIYNNIYMFIVFNSVKYIYILYILYIM
jgi:hypothetical protein